MSKQKPVFHLHGRNISERGVESVTDVKILYVVEQAKLCVFVGKEIRTVNQFFFQAGVKTLDDGVVVRAAFRRQ